MNLNIHPVRAHVKYERVEQNCNAALSFAGGGTNAPDKTTRVSRIIGRALFFFFCSSRIYLIGSNAFRAIAIELICIQAAIALPPIAAFSLSTENRTPVEEKNSF